MPLTQLDNSSFDEARVLVVGDIMLDQFRYGTVTRISPEAPVPVMHVTSDQAMLGGAGNVLANLAALGCKCDAIAVIGDDEAGRECSRMVEGLGANPDYLITISGRPTTIKTRLISGGQQLFRCDEGVTTPCGNEFETELISLFMREAAQYDAVAISDYAKGVLSDRVLQQTIAHCNALDIPVIVDPKRSDMSVYSGATAIKPNRNELANFAGYPCPNLVESVSAAEELMARTGAAVLLTLSEDGMALFRPNHAMRHFRAAADEVFDVSGAGDTALAIFAASLAVGIPMEESAHLANVGASAVVRKLGTATISRIELGMAAMTRQPSKTGAVSNRQEAALQVAQWKADNLRVGFTNGCFDILHGGHVEILRKARDRCDRLVVGLNSDASVRRLKGHSRPVQSELSRAYVLAAIDAVDLVIIFDEDTPLELVTALMPTDIFKGADYEEHEVIGGKEVKAAGGRVHLIELVPGLSTTRAIERIRQGTTSDQNAIKKDPQQVVSAAVEYRHDTQ